MLGWNIINTRTEDKVAKIRVDEISSIDNERDLYEGNVQLEIRSFESFRQINRCTRYLASLENLRIVSESWSEDEGFKILVSVQAPLALEDLLHDMPEVARVYFNGYKSGYAGLKRGWPKMVVEMRANEVAREPVLV